MNAIIPIGATMIISIAGYLFSRKTSVSSWMNKRRVDGLKRKDPMKCGVCGAPMKIKKRHTGKHAGKDLLVCSSYPECRKVEWD